MPKISRGFTLIELMVVISIIAVLSVIGITVYSGVQKSTRDAKRRADLHAIQLALEQYKLVNGNYPSPETSSTYRGWAASDLTPTTYIPNLGSSFSDGKLPVDPINDATHHYMYYYYTSADIAARPDWRCDGLNQYYVLGAVKMENTVPVGSCWHCAIPGGRNWCAPGDEFGGGFALGNYW